MNKNFWKQFAIALALFLAGYFTFNTDLFAQPVGGRQVERSSTDI